MNRIPHAADRAPREPGQFQPESALRQYPCFKKVDRQDTKKTANPNHPNWTDFTIKIEVRCDAARITLNKNAIPYDPQPPMIGSGIRVGTPAITTQAMTEGDMKEVASLIGRAVRDADGSSAPDIGAAVGALVARHPAYPRRG